mgnify:CR=1 FL=1
MSTHIEADKGEIAETVLLPGDPMRAKWIAQTFLEKPYCYNDVRGMLGYTGTYKGQRISVQGTGMGIPSALIYCHELINDYGVKNLIRVGSSGSYQKDIGLRDIVIAMAASSTSGINNSRFINADYSPTANFELLMKVAKYAEANNIKIKAGNVLSADEFYDDDYDSSVDVTSVASSLQTTSLTRATTRPPSLLQGLDLKSLRITKKQSMLGGGISNYSSLPPRPRRVWKVNDASLSQRPIFHPPLSKYTSVFVADAAAPSIVAIRIAECLRLRSISTEFA